MKEQVFTVIIRVEFFKAVAQLEGRGAMTSHCHQSTFISDSFIETSTSVCHYICCRSFFLLLLFLIPKTSFRSQVGIGVL